MEKIFLNKPAVNNREIWRKRLINGLLFIICILVIISISKSWYSYKQSQNIITSAQDKYRQVLDENGTVKRDLARAQSSDFVEKQARQKLNMGKVGEITVILPTISLPPEPSPTPVENGSNWKKWVKLFI